MIYREYLVMRKALAWYACIALVLELLNVRASAISEARVFDYGTIVFTSGLFAAAFAWIFGVALGNASREAARVLWVLPATRAKLALQLIAVDFVGITAAYACNCALMLLAFAVQHLRFGAHISGTVNAADIVLLLTLSYATYGCSALVGMAGRRVPYCGIISAPALAIWFTLAETHAGMGAILRIPILANPFAVFNTTVAISSWQEHHSAIDMVSSSLQWLGTVWETPVLIGIAVVTCAIAVMFWQRAQVIY